MYPTLFPSDNITASLGLGKLTETLSCIVSEEVNGDYSLELRYPIKGERYEALLNGGTIQVISPTYVSGNATPRMNRQWFDIYKHSIPIDGVVTFYANHVSRRLTMGVFHGTQVDGNHIAYVWGTDASPSAPYNGMDFRLFTHTPAIGHVMDEPDTKSPLAVLIGAENSLVSNYGGEFAFNCDPNIVMRCNVYYIDRRGANRGVEIRHGFNLTDLEKTKDYSGTYNAVVPYWEDSEGNRVFANGFLVQSDPPQTPIRAVPLNCSSWYDTQPTSEQLISTAQNHLANHTPWVEAETLTVDFINGAEIGPHGADIALGDTVHVYWQDGRVDALLRVMSYKYDVLAERYSELKLGTQQTQFVAVTGAESYSGATGGGGGGGGVPDGGTTGQVLTKNSDANQDTVWKGFSVVNETVAVPNANAIEKTFTVAGNGIVWATCSIEAAAGSSDYGSAISEVYLNGTKMSVGICRTNNANTQAIASCTTAALPVVDGDKIRMYNMCTKAGTRTLYRNLLCFGCTVS